MDVITQSIRQGGLSMFDFIRGRFSHQFSSFRRRWCQQQALPLTEVLSADRMSAVVEEEGVRFREGVFTPSVTVWTFLGQVFNPDHSCREAVARLIAFLVGQGRRPCAAGTGAYCAARQRLPERLLARLVRETGDQLHAAVSADSLRIAGRAVYVVDGTTVSMPDTPANQQTYPQSRAQRPGVGFPLARLVALFSLASGAVLDMAVGPYRGKGTGEPSLLRQLLGRLQPNTVLLGDCYFCSYWILALLLHRDVYGVFCLHQRRPVDFRQGRRLGPDDRLVVWKRPPRPDWMTTAEYDDLLDELVIREVRVRVRQAGFRTRELVVATTLVDPDEAPAEQIARLYRARWHAELHLRSLKVVLGMDVLRCKTPEMVRKELWMHLLVYNLVRELMAQTAAHENVEPHEISFKGTLQTLNRFQELLPMMPAPRWPELYDTLLHAVGVHRVAHRPNRYEPRAVKRRPKPHDLLTVPRDVARKRLLRAA
jgi:hypothetical protein